jgi:hypothetical protein
MKIEAKNELTREIRSVLSYCSGRSLAIFDICAPVNLSYAEEPIHDIRLLFYVKILFSLL